MAASKKKATKKKAKAPVKKAGGKKKAAAKAAAPKRASSKASASKKTAAKVKPKASAKSAPKTTAAKVARVVAKVKDTVKSTLAKVTHAVAPDYQSVLQPLDDRILVAAEAAREQTDTGLYIPGSVDTRPNRGKVLAIGRGRRNKKGQVRPLAVAVGEHVMFAEGAGVKVTLAGAELLILREDEVLGLVE